MMTVEPPARAGRKLAMLRARYRLLPSSSTLKKSTNSLHAAVWSSAHMHRYGHQLARLHIDVLPALDYAVRRCCTDAHMERPQSALTSHCASDHLSAAGLSVLSG